MLLLLVDALVFPFPPFIANRAPGNPPPLPSDFDTTRCSSRPQVSQQSSYSPPSLHLFITVLVSPLFSPLPPPLPPSLLPPPQRVLSELLFSPRDSDHHHLVSLVADWPVQIYDAPAMATALAARLKEFPHSLALRLVRRQSVHGNTATHLVRRGAVWC